MFIPKNLYTFSFSFAHRLQWEISKNYDKLSRHLNKFHQQLQIMKNVTFFKKNLLQLLQVYYSMKR